MKYEQQVSVYPNLPSQFPVTLDRLANRQTYHQHTLEANAVKTKFVYTRMYTFISNWIGVSHPRFCFYYWTISFALKSIFLNITYGNKVDHFIWIQIECLIPSVSGGEPKLYYSYILTSINKVCFSFPIAAGKAQIFVTIEPLQNSSIPVGRSKFLFKIK